jgi:hypothetical protein
MTVMILNINQSIDQIRFVLDLFILCLACSEFPTAAVTVGFSVIIQPRLTILCPHIDNGGRMSARYVSFLWSTDC